jgi:hypothetical protein
MQLDKGEFSFVWPHKMWIEEEQRLVGCWTWKTATGRGISLPPINKAMMPPSPRKFPTATHLREDTALWSGHPLALERTQIITSRGKQSKCNKEKRKPGDVHTTTSPPRNPIIPPPSLRDRPEEWGQRYQVKDDPGIQPPIHSAITIVSLQLECALPSPALIGGPSDHAFTTWPIAAFSHHTFLLFQIQTKR